MEARLDRILVVDDNAQNQLVAEAHLVAAGYAVTLASGGREAIAEFEADPPALVLLDVLMPGMDGYETCRRLRELREGADTPILFLSALADVGAHERAIESGADDFLTKPIQRTELLMRVGSLVRIRRLNREIRASADLIRSQRDALARAQAQKDELTALVVHDLKSPLTAILGHAELLAADEGLAESARESAVDIALAAHAMHRMVMDLLDISASEDGVIAPKTHEFDLGALVADAVAPLGPRLSERRQTIEVEVERGEIRLRADRDMVRRLVENLVDNALRYTPAGGAIRISATKDPECRARLSVADEAAGIPDAHKKRVFDKYVRVDARDVHARTSRGLGLVFCRIAAEAHGGTIWVEDNQPKGARFVATLPLAD